MNIRFDEIMDRLRAVEPPDGWPGVFLLPEGVMRDLYEHVVHHGARRCLELGTGYGATTCVVAAALEETGGDRVVTIDLYGGGPIDVRVLAQVTQLERFVQPVVEPLGYNWYLADALKDPPAERRRPGAEGPGGFDLCLLDGAHEWVQDALAVNLVEPLLRPGAWLVLDDLNFHLRSMDNWPESHGQLSDRELDTDQVGMVYDLVVRRHPAFGNFRVMHEGRIGWAQKRPAVWPPTRRLQWQRSRRQPLPSSGGAVYAAAS